MKKYKLLKDLPTWKAGEEFWIGEDENLYGLLENGLPVMVYHFSTLFRFDLLNNKEWFEEVQEKQKSVWDLKKGDKYYYIDNNSWVESSWDNLQFDDLNLIEGNIFISKEEAEKELEKRRAIQRIKKYCWENNIELADRDFVNNPDNLKIILNFNVSIKKFGIVNFWINMDTSIFFFKKKEDAEKILEKFEEDLKIIFDV